LLLAHEVKPNLNSAAFSEFGAIVLISLVDNLPAAPVILEELVIQLP
jgi:hypothetical protein